jgi:type I restriction enzyme S subunit
VTAFVPLKRVVDINRRELPESTDPDYQFRYVDIGTVGQGVLIDEPRGMRFGDAPSRARRLVRSTDTIVSTVRTYLRAVWPVQGTSDDLVVSTGFAVLSPREAINPRFLGWLARSDALIEEVVARSVGVSYPAINPSQLGDITVPIPSHQIQSEVADFLDIETARIDALVAARHRQIGLLNERSDALIERALWLDERSQPRAVMGLRRAASRIDVGIAEAATHAYRESGTPLLRSTNIRRRFLDLSDLLFIDLEFARRRASKTIRGGDLITVRTGNVGVTAVVPPELDGSQCFTQLITTPLPGASSQFLCMALNCGRAVEYFKLLGWGSAQANISVPTLAAAPIPDVPYADQHRLVLELDRPIARIEALVAACSKQADLLIERRQALITAAVTGQLDLAREIAEEAS